MIPQYKCDYCDKPAVTFCRDVIDVTNGDPFFGRVDTSPRYRGGIQRHYCNDHAPNILETIAKCEKACKR